MKCNFSIAKGNLILFRKYIMSSSVFWCNYYIFAGGGDDNEKFLDSIPFRKYLNKHFDVGKSSVLPEDECDVVHWVFTPHGGKLQDSYLKGQQPIFDQHCTMFSFYLELYLSRYKCLF
jgi:hypothetical protein